MTFEVGTLLEGKVTATTKFGAFVALPEGRSGMVHISEIAASYVKEVTDHIEVGQIVKVVVLGEDERGRISLSIKQAQRQDKNPAAASKSFEDMLSKFMADSTDKISDLKKGEPVRNRRSSGGGNRK